VRRVDVEGEAYKRRHQEEKGFEINLLNKKRRKQKKRGKIDSIIKKYLLAALETFFLALTLMDDLPVPNLLIWLICLGLPSAYTARNPILMSSQDDKIACDEAPDGDSLLMNHKDSVLA
jgi:hypothetical protein